MLRENIVSRTTQDFGIGIVSVLLSINCNCKLVNSQNLSFTHTLAASFLDKLKLVVHHIDLEATAQRPSPHIRKFRMKV